MATTIKDIARKLNISVSTVSYALNDGPRSVPEHVKLKVKQVAQELNYRPNRVARSLIKGESHVIGIVPTAVRKNMTVSPYFVSALNGVVNACENLNQDVMILTRNSSEDSSEAVETLLDGRVDGVVFIAPLSDSPAIPRLRELGFPHVVISSSQYPGSPSFQVDNAAGVNLIIDHLVAQGHTKIAHMAGAMDLEDGAERFQAFHDRMAYHGLKVNPNWIVYGQFHTVIALEAARQLLDQPEVPTAVFCANDESALSMLRVALQAGLDPKKDLAIAGFDDTFSSQLAIPPLTTVSQPIERLANEATHALLKTIREGTSISGKRFSPELIVRDSTLSPKKDN